MNRSAGKLARKLAKIQGGLRQELFEELMEHEGELEDLFDPCSYSPLPHDLREKYLSRLYLIQGILQQLARVSKDRSKPSTRVLSIVAEDQQTLVNRVNRKLVKLNGAKVLDVKFIHGAGNEKWSALITYELHPFMEEADETAAWM